VELDNTDDNMYAGQNSGDYDYGDSQAVLKEVLSEDNKSDHNLDNMISNTCVDLIETSLEKELPTNSIKSLSSTSSTLCAKSTGEGDHNTVKCLDIHIYVFVYSLFLYIL
jgi:hypothetical protein